MRIEYGHLVAIVSLHDDILHVEHIQNRKDTVTFHLGQITATLYYRLLQTSHLRTDMRLDNLLITT